MEYKDYYETLGVDRGAETATIKKSYRKLARKYHPDVSKEASAEAKFKDVSEAYNVLKDKEKRAAYDQLGADWKAGQDFQAPPGWEHTYAGSGGGNRQQYSTGGGADFGDFFDSLFGRSRGFDEGMFQGGGRGGQARSAPVPDQRASVQIDLADAYQGTTRQLSLSEPVVTADGQQTNKQRSIKVKIPKGITAGQTMRLKGQGALGRGGGARGDLFLEIRFAPHSVYQVDGKNITLELPVAPWEAALGGKIAVPLPDGKSISLTLPAGSNSGKHLRLKGKGIPAKEPGNLVIVLKVVAPEAKTEAAKKAYEALKQATDFDPREGLV